MTSLRAHYKATLRVGWPIAVGQVGTIMVGFADTLMVGHYSTPSLAAASFVNSVFNLFLFGCSGRVSIAAPVPCCARRWWPMRCTARSSWPAS